MYQSIQHKNSDSYIMGALLLSLGIHALLMLINFRYDPPEIPVRDDAIKITITPPENVIKNKALKVESKYKESEKIPPKLEKKVIAGTKKIVPNSTVLGNPKADSVKKVQKGDPLSKNMTKYKPGTEFRKLEQTNIGSGAKSNLKTADVGGGSGDTYNAPNFAVKSNLAPLGSRFKIKGAVDDNGAGAGKGGGIGDGIGIGGGGDGSLTGSPNGTLQKAKILTNVGSLVGAADGEIGSSKGAEGLSTKGTIVLAGIPDETVILGSMDPELIRRVLMEHIAQFRYCYQQELETSSKAKDAAGIINLDFTINPNGNVSRADIGGKSNISGKVRGCVKTVLIGIQFPKPKGGGIIEVKQPMNFYPRNM